MENEILEKIIKSARLGAKKCPSHLSAVVMNSINSETTNAKRHSSGSFFLYPFKPAAALVYLLAVIVLGGYMVFGKPKTVSVTFTFYNPEAQMVSIAGDFNGWEPEKGVMKLKNGAWAATIAMKPGHYQYMFVVDGQKWVPDPASSEYVQGSFGDINSLIEVEG